MTDDRRSTLRFGDRACDYAAFRPPYPAQAIDAAIAGLGDPAVLQIADIGAGTGISSRLFADRGSHVIAVEPNGAMRTAAQPHPNVCWCSGTAEASGLADGSVDLAVACQAFHWFATGAAMAQFVRIARRRAAMLQYERNEDDAFTKAYGDVVRAHARDDTEALRLRGIAAFAQFPHARVTRFAFSSHQNLNLAGLLGRASSASYLPRDGPECLALQRDLTGIFARHQRSGCVGLAMITCVLIADW